MRPLLRAAVLWAVLAAAGPACTTTVPIVSRSNLKEVPPAETGAVLPLRFELNHAYIGQGGCALYFAREGQLELVRVQFAREQELVFASLAPGRYRPKDLYCGRYHWNLMARQLPVFQVFTGRISMLGAVSFTVREDGQLEHHQRGRAIDREETENLISRLPPEAAARVVSGYAGQAIALEQVALPARWTRSELKYASGASRRSSAHDFPSFQSCYDAEERVNGLWLGNLKLEVSFRDGALADVTGWDDSFSTFTSTFKECVKATLRAYSPPSRDGLVYTLYL